MCSSFHLIFLYVCLSFFYHLSNFFFYFFFFQAEDGIRDIGVTGVQTCALPICSQLVVIPLVGEPDVNLEGIEGRLLQLDGLRVVPGGCRTSSYSKQREKHRYCEQPCKRNKQD